MVVIKVKIVIIMWCFIKIIKFWFEYKIRRSFGLLFFNRIFLKINLFLFYMFF